MSVRIISAFALTCAIGLAAGCDMNKAKDPGAVTQGEIAKTESKLKGEQANMMLKGENLITEGKTQKAKGEALKETGKEIEGDREIRAGELKIKQGEEHLNQAKEMKTEMDAPRSSSSRDRVNGDIEARTASETTVRPNADRDAEIRLEAAPADRDAEIRLEAAPADGRIDSDTDAKVNVDVDASK